MYLSPTLNTLHLEFLKNCDNWLKWILTWFSNKDLIRVLRPWWNTSFRDPYWRVIMLKHDFGRSHFLVETLESIIKELIFLITACVHIKHFWSENRWQRKQTDKVQKRFLKFLFAFPFRNLLFVMDSFQFEFWVYYLRKLLQRSLLLIYFYYSLESNGFDPNKVRVRIKKILRLLFSKSNG